MLSKYLPYATNLIEEIKQIKGVDKNYVVDIMDRYFRADIEFSSKLHRYQLLNSLVNSPEYNILTAKQKKVVQLLMEGNLSEAEKLAEKL
jgi:hypothetical protein